MAYFRFSSIFPEWGKKIMLERVFWFLILAYSLFQSGLLVAIWMNHLLGPDIQRGVMLETVNRMIQGLPTYPTPTAEYVGGVHNPLFAVLGTIASLVIGEGATVLRFVAIIGALGSWVLIFVIVKDATNSSLMGFIAFGLFASAYLAFDGYLDYANSDSWLLFSSLLGLYILNKTKTKRGWFLGILILCISFWFKQHGAFMAVAGLVYLTLVIRQKAIPYWVMAFLLVPAAYIFIGPLLFGDKFIYYTYTVPRAWSEFNYYTIERILKYFIRHWAILGATSLVGVVCTLKAKNKLSLWEITLPFALLVGVLGSLDPGSENNQYILPGVSLIICGTITFHRFYAQWNKHNTSHGYIVVSQTLILLAFLQNYYYISSAFFPKTAWKDYDSLVEYIQSLDGTVYMPTIGQLPYDIHLKYTASWVQLEDLVRGPGKNTYDNPLIRSILTDIIVPKGKMYIITEVPLEQDSLLSFLSDYYILVDDLGDQYKSLRAVPGRFERGWLRYVYVHK